MAETYPLDRLTVPSWWRSQVFEIKDKKLNVPPVRVVPGHSIEHYRPSARCTYFFSPLSKTLISLRTGRTRGTRNIKSGKQTIIAVPPMCPLFPPKTQKHSWAEISRGDLAVVTDMKILDMFWAVLSQPNSRVRAVASVVIIPIRSALLQVFAAKLSTPWLTDTTLMRVI